jgi:hypothetical protein
MKKTDLLSLIAQSLSNNIGNKLSVELAQGMVAVIAAQIPDDPVEAVAEVD